MVLLMANELKKRYVPAITDKSELFIRDATKEARRKKLGRPMSAFNPGLEEAVISAAAQGKTITEIVNDVANVSFTAFRLYILTHPEFKNKFEAARHIGYDVLAEELLEIPDTYQQVDRGRLKSDNIKWLLSKRKPETYGDRIDVTVQGPDIKGAMAEARARSGLMPIPANVADAQAKVIKDVVSKCETDNKSVEQDQDAEDELDPLGLLE